MKLLYQYKMELLLRARAEQSIEESRTKKNRAEQNRAEQSRIE
jgi:hypothetical protein